MGIFQSDIKLLWGRSGNRCAICKTELSQDKQSGHGAFPLGEQAHIVGEKSNAARGSSAMTEIERNSYHNLVLLCPNHHTEIDKNEKEWTIERLYLTKSQHELWVQQTLGGERKISEEELLPPFSLNDEEKEILEAFISLESNRKFEVIIDDFFSLDSA